MEPRADVGQNDFLSKLSVETLGLLAPYLMDVLLHRGTTIAEPGEELECVWFPTSSVLSVVTTMESGHDVEACTIGREGAYGVLNALGSSISTERVVVLIPGRAVKMPAARLRAASALSVNLTDFIIRHAQANTAQIQQTAACNALHSVDVRLCRWLLMTHDRVGGDQLPLTQEFLSLMLGVQRTTVSRVASSLQEAGLVRYSRGKIQILDRGGLEAQACECYQSVRHKYVELLDAQSTRRR
ncbi:Crp/Fnr family transcriptional regulator [Phenylobacterium sp.]|uniref:Crp/Fnr family transcriptional regulator n=1 Tax=Phenylobacterium sp. TaxID=1871053 RepID=UPI002614E069|nr:Crp/Fnr family transcriptional regulator [Phenylobacterium sp.]